MPTPGQSTLFTVFEEMVVSTRRNHSKDITDAVSNHNALYRKINEKKRKRIEDGGLSIVANLEYAENSTYQRYDGYDELNLAPSDVLTAAEYPWRQAAVNVSASGREIRMNSGENRMVNLVKTRISNAKKSAANGMSRDIYSSGSLPNQISGIQVLVADNGQGTVGGIDASTFTFWRNVVQSAASPLQGGSAITPSPSTIESLMLPLWLRLTRGADKPDLIVADETYFTYYEQSQTSLKRYAPSDNGQGGMVAMKYKSADVIHDSAASGIPSAHMYFLNTDYFELVVHEDADWEMLPELRAINQDAINIPILWMGNLICTHRGAQGVLKA